MMTDFYDEPINPNHMVDCLGYECKQPILFTYAIFRFLRKIMRLRPQSFR
jgi:hypothetical protein